MVAAAAMVTQSPALSRMQGALKRNLAVQLFLKALVLPAALALGACNSVDFESFRMPDMSVVAPRTTATLRDIPLRPVTSDDLVSTDGRCTGGVAAPEPGLEPGSTQQAEIPLVPSAVALDMTECEVVKRAGHPEKIDFGTNERGERTVVLSYILGVRPGIYTFTSGRLSSIARAPEPPPPPKPARPQKRAPPKRTTT
jgi:hypothetical protein